MANIPINRKDYGTSEFNGFPPNTIIGSLSTQAIASGSSYTIAGDFKDHKTIFAFESTNTGDVSVTFKHGDTYQGVQDLTVTVPSGKSYIWLDSAKFVRKETGEITVETTAAGSLAMYGFELR